MLALERVLKKKLAPAERLSIAAEVGSDLPLFLIGGTVLGVGRGEEVYPLPDFPVTPCVVALPDIAVSTPKAFAEWDRLCAADTAAREKKQVPRLRRSFASEPSSSLGMTGLKELGMTAMKENEKLTAPTQSDRMLRFGREISAWLSAAPAGQGGRRSGVSSKTGGRAENPLLDLVRTGIENDFERVVFPQYPELRKVKRVLERSGARYASLSGSGSAIYGLFHSREKAEAAARTLKLAGTHAVVTSTLTRRQYWNKLLAASS
jgi:4-diphosphocytidyl-2-C-methyl-D-erythritol kinase